LHVLVEDDPLGGLLVELFEGRWVGLESLMADGVVEGL